MFCRNENRILIHKLTLAWNLICLPGSSTSGTCFMFSFSCCVLRRNWKHILIFRSIWNTDWGKTPFEQNLILSFSLLRRKGSSVWIASTLWSRRSPNFWTSQSCFLSSNQFFLCEHPFSDKTDGYNWPRCTLKNQYGGEIWHIRLGFETILATWRAYSIFTQSFSRRPKSKQKKGSASRVRKECTLFQMAAI